MLIFFLFIVRTLKGGKDRDDFTSNYKDMEKYRQ